VVNSSVDRLPPTTSWLMLCSLATAAGFVLFLCLLFEPRWTNDDVAMSMVAHGYGFAMYGTPHLMFSNVLWGYFVRTLPSVNGVQGYSLGTVAALMVVGWATLYFLLRLGVGYMVGVLAIVLLLARPTLFPQFTINAGLLTLAAVIGWKVHARLGGLGTLLSACLLAFFGYLVRSEEFFLVLGVALPFLPWRALRDRRHVQIAFLLLGLAIASAAAIDRYAYSGPEWQHFKELNSARVSFTDFGVGERLKQRPEIMARHGFSVNDVDLISHWFFVDPLIADPNALSEMLAELGPRRLQDGSAQGLAAIQEVTAPSLLPLLLSAVLLFVLAPRWPAAIAWALCLAALFVMGVMGRPGVLRVYIPLMTLLVLAPLVAKQVTAGVRRRLSAVILFFACVGNFYVLVPEALPSAQLVQQVKADLKSLPTRSIVAWGAGFPFEFAFPILGNNSALHDFRLYALGVLTHAPFSVHVAEQKAGHGMIDRLRTAEGVSVIASQPHINLLRNYCNEHLKGELREIAIRQTSSLTVRQVRCGVSTAEGVSNK